MPNLIELTENLRPIFVAAGWPKTSFEPLPDIFPEEHPASEILEQLAGLKVGACGAGENCATSDVEFGIFEHLYSNEDFLSWQRHLGSTLASIGEVHHGHGALVMDEQGRCYVMSFVHDGFWLQGRNFVQAMDNLLFGRKPGDQVALGSPGAVPVI